MRKLGLKMKRPFANAMIVVLLAASGAINASAMAQATVDMELENATMVEFINQLSTKTGYEFVYRKGIFDNAQPVSINVKDSSLEQVLNEIVLPRGYSYSVLDKVVTLRVAPENQQPAARVSVRRITGNVKDNSGEALPGATIILRGTTRGAVADANGQFVIEVPAQGSQVLRISFLGMNTRDITLANSAVYDIVLTEIPTTVSEIVVTGYQTISRERSAGSYASITGSEIAEKAAIKGNIIESLEGLTTGLSVNYGEGEEKFLMRGTNSVNASQEPLYVVDGVPMSAANVELMINENDIARFTMLKDATAASIWGAQAANGVIVINTKKGFSTAVAGGGLARNLKVSYNGSYTYRGLPDYGYHNYMSSSMFIKTAQEIFDPGTYSYDDITTNNQGVALNSFPVVLPHEQPMYQFLIDNDQGAYDKAMSELASRNNRSQIEKYLMQRSMFTKHNVSVVGGTHNYSVYGSFAYEYDQGVNLTKNNKYSMNIRQDFNVTRWLALDLTTNLAVVHGKNGLLPEYTATNSLLPYMMLKDSEGNNLSHSALRYTDEIRLNAEQLSNIDLDYVPLDELKNGFNKNTTLNARVNAGITVRIMDGLQFEGRYQYQRNSGEAEVYRNNHSYSTRFELVQFTTAGTTPTYHLPSTGGKYNSVSSYENSWTARNQLSFDRAFNGTLHHVTVLAGTEVRASRIWAKTSNLRGYNPQTLLYPSYNEQSLSSNGVSGILVVPGASGVSRLSNRMFSSDDSETRFVSFYANGAYTFAGKYSVNGSIRIDQSNLFGSDPSVQFKPIWSAGLAWNIGNESFMDNVDLINRLNLRLSYGLGGNSPDPGMGGSYDILRASSNSNFSGIGYTILTPANNQLVWEKTRTLNIGVDVSMLNSAIMASLDVYSKKTTDLLGYVSLNPASGWGSALGNLGEITNKGFEFTLNTRNIRTQNFMWTTTFTLTNNKNKVVEVYDQTSLTALNKVYQRYLTGYAAHSIFAYQWAGLDDVGDPQVWDYQDDGQGNLEKVKVKQSGDLQSMDAAKYMGSSQPLWYGGLSNAFRYKNFELSFMFVYNLGHKMRRNDGSFYAGRMHTNINKNFADRWKTTGDENHTDIPSYVSGTDFSNSRRYLSFYNYADINVVSASYIKLRDLTFSYSLPKQICAKISAESVKVRLQASNLFYWAANDEGIDPEAYNYRSGTRVTRYGPSFSVGLSINFR